jgi:hypothetical protein
MLTTEHAKLIAQCKNLRILDVEASALTDESLLLLSELPRIDRNKCKRLRCDSRNNQESESSTQG